MRLGWRAQRAYLTLEHPTKSSTGGTNNAVSTPDTTRRSHGIARARCSRSRLSKHQTKAQTDRQTDLHRQHRYHEPKTPLQSKTKQKNIPRTHLPSTTGSFSSVAVVVAVRLVLLLGRPPSPPPPPLVGFAAPADTPQPGDARVASPSFAALVPCPVDLPPPIGECFIPPTPTAPALLDAGAFPRPWSPFFPLFLPEVGGSASGIEAAGRKARNGEVAGGWGLTSWDAVVCVVKACDVGEGEGRGADPPVEHFQASPIGCWKNSSGVPLARIALGSYGRRRSKKTLRHACEERNANKPRDQVHVAVRWNTVAAVPSIKTLPFLCVL